MQQPVLLARHAEQAFDAEHRHRAFGRCDADLLAADEALGLLLRQDDAGLMADGKSPGALLPSAICPLPSSFTASATFHGPISVRRSDDKCALVPSSRPTSRAMART